MLFNSIVFSFVRPIAFYTYIWYRKNASTQSAKYKQPEYITTMFSSSKYLCLLIVLIFQFNSFAENYYVHPVLGNDLYTGQTKAKPFKTLERIRTIKLQPGDSIFLASNTIYQGSLIIEKQQGTVDKPIVITTILWNESDTFTPAIIDFKGKANGILIQDSSGIQVSHIKLTANGFNSPDTSISMRCGILVTNSDAKKMERIVIKNIAVKDVFYENKGFFRGEKEIKTANGTQKYGWGIRVINKSDTGSIENVKIQNCQVYSVSHTGIKLTGRNKNILTY